MISSKGRSPLAIIEIAFGHMYGPRCPPLMVSSLVSPKHNHFIYPELKQLNITYL